MMDDHDVISAIRSLIAAVRYLGHAVPAGSPVIPMAQWAEDALRRHAEPAPPVLASPAETAAEESQ